MPKVTINDLLIMNQKSPKAECFRTFDIL